jgi:hypothetical protein
MKLLHILENEDDYKDDHSAPDKDNGAPLFDLTLNGVYPKDVYSHKGFSYYSTSDKYDQQAYSIVSQFKDRQNAKLPVYRAVPKNPNIKTINNNDWVTIVRDYAKDHGLARFGKGNYKILTKSVHARDIFTAGDSWLEWGLDPQPQNDNYTKNQYFIHWINNTKNNIERVNNNQTIIMLNKYPNDPFYNQPNETILKYLNDKLTKLTSDYEQFKNNQ